MMKKTFLLFFLVISNIFTISQIQKEWGRNLPGPLSNEHGTSVTLDADNNVYVAGIISQCVAIAKYSPGGNLLWSKQSYNCIFDEANQISVDANGNVYVTGSKIIQTRDIFLYKLASNGDSLWFKTFDSPGSNGEYPCGMVFDNNNNIYLTGVSLSANSIFVTLKYNSSGDVLWTKTYNMLHTNYSTPNSIFRDTENNIYVIGRSSPNSIVRSVVILKYNNSGTELWTKYIDTLELDPNSSCIDLNNNFYITGNDLNYHCRTVKLSKDGVILWSRTFPGNLGDIRNAVSSNNYCYVSATATVSSQYDIVSLCYNQNGLLQWSDTVNTSGAEKPIMIQCDNQNNALILGDIFGQIGFIKYNSTGQLLTLYSDSTAASLGYDFTVKNNIIAATGERYSSTGYFYTAKYSQVIGIHPISNEIPESYSLSQNYPNPFNPATKIKFELPKAGFVKIIIYDAAGSEIIKLVNDNLQAGVFETDFDASQYPSGVYFYRLVTEEFTVTRKMILIK